MKKLCTSLSLLLVSIVCFSQAKMEISTLVFPDTVYTNNSYTVRHIIKNTGDSLYNGFVDVYYTSVNNWLPKAIYHDDLIQLSPGDSVIVQSDTVQFNSPSYLIGNDVVVIWPTSKLTVNNTLTQDIFVIASIKTDAANRYSSSYLNEKLVLNRYNQQLIIYLPKELEEKLIETKIVSINGEEVHSDKTKKTTFPIQHLPKGIYITQIYYYDNRHSAIKWVNY